MILYIGSPNYGSPNIGSPKLSLMKIIITVSDSLLLLKLWSKLEALDLPRRFHLHLHKTQDILHVYNYCFIY